MRIKLNKLPAKPDKYYVRFVNGVHAIVRLFHEPCYCVHVCAHALTDNGVKEANHCYQISKEQYEVYMAGSVEEQRALIAKGGAIYNDSKCKE